MDYKWLLLSTDGRLNRKPYWMTALVIFAVSIVVGILDAIIFGTEANDIPVLSMIYALAVIWPGIALGVKRLHDRGRSGWFFLLTLVPILNLWPMIEIYFLRGTQGSNNYGTDPLAR